MIGGINPWKNQNDFVKVAKKVLEERKDITFYLAGEIVFEDYRNELISVIINSGKENNVIFTGFISNIPAFLSQIDFTVHTMPYESFGRVFLESMAAKKPVVAFNSGGASEIIVDGKTGILVPVGDIDSMSKAICRLIDDSELRLHMG